MADSTQLYEQCAGELAALVEKVFAAIAPVETAFTELIAQADEGPLTTGTLADLDGHVDEILAASQELLGAGVVVRPGLLSDSERFLEWRQRQADGSLAPLILDVAADSDDPYDYPTMDWFRVPSDERRRMVGGPYVDYRGNERCTLTFAMPVVVDGEFLGVAGADQSVNDLETSVLPVLRRIEAPAALVNHERRVVAANSSRLSTGQRVPREWMPVSQTFPVVEDLGWQLIVLGDST